MPEDRSSHADEPRAGDPLGDVINLLAAPLASGIRSYEQFRRGIDELFRTVENLNTTMQNLNETAERVNRLLGDVEEPIRAMVPRVTRTITAADELMDAVGGPISRAAPNMVRLADTLTTPAFVALPERFDEIVRVMNEVSRRLAPLANFAESAGGMFGLRVPGLPRPGAATTHARPDESVPAASAPPDATRSTATKQSPTKRGGAKKTGGKKATAKKAAAKNATAKKASGSRATGGH